MTNLTPIVVFTGDLSYAVRKGIVTIDQSIADLSWLIVIHSPKKTLKTLLRNQWHNLLRNGWRWIPYQTADIIQRLLPDNTPPIEPNQPGYNYTQQALEARPNVRIIHVPDIHAPETLALVRDYAPVLGLSLTAPLLKPSLFSIPSLGTLNLHRGRLPEFRGMPPAFWSLWHDLDIVGCTVHWVDEHLDTGDIVKKVIIPRQSYSTLKGLQLILCEAGIHLMNEAVAGVLNGTASRTAQASGGNTYKKPTLAQIATLKRKINKLCQQKITIRQLLKDSFFLCRIQLHRLLLHKLAPAKITVLLYHRVTDEVRDNLTMGIEQFDRQMALLRKYYQVLSIEQVAASETIQPSARPCVCVTFDDGYLDNFEYAVPILLKHGIPCGFFVSTGIIDNQGVFPHDVRRGNGKIPVMTWSQLQAMHAAGFTIGSHSVSHIDCASESEERVRQELSESMAVIQRQLGVQDVMFGYPYGGRQHMTAERLELVKETGYSACLSAYGGVNVATVDRFNIVRYGIHYEFSDLAFRHRCEGIA